MPSSGRLKPLLVGEQNPYGSDPEFALYPSPEGSAGYRLCCLILGMRRAAYLRLFDRCNLCSGQWNTREAKRAAIDLTLLGEGRRRFILLGSKVCSAFGVKFVPFTLPHDRMLILPHPSGRCHLWNDGRSFLKARAGMATLAPETFDHIGEADQDGY